MKKFILISAISACFFTGCLTEKQFKTIVDERNKKVWEVNLSSDLDNTVKIQLSDKILSQFGETRVETKTSYFIPAIVFWAWNHTLHCSAKHDFLTDRFKQTFVAKAHEHGVELILRGKILEIEIGKLPLHFAYTSNGFALYYFYGYSALHDERVKMQNDNDLVVNYAIIKDGEILKDETLTVNFNTVFANHSYSTKKLLNTFLDNLMLDCDFAAEWIIERIIDDL